MALPRIFLEELKRRNDIVDVVSSHVQLKRRGKNLLGLCPFHSEKSPSFTVYPENDSFYCFGCNAGGDVITFVSRAENLDYMEAVRWLAQRSGLQMPEEQADDSASKLRLRILEINREAGRFFFKALSTPEGKPGLSYLRGRGLDGEVIRRFGLGYAPDSGYALVNHLKTLGYTPEEMIAADVARRSKNGNPYDRYRSRVMFPIFDLRGNVVAFGGRILTDEKPKYINTSDTLVYHKSNALFAMNLAKDSGKRQMILAEGYMDVIALHRAGFTNAIASLGTALTEEQARIIRKYAEEAVVCYDSDEAGQRAAQRAIPILKKAGLYVRVLTVPGNKDPDEFMRSYGADGPLRFKALLEQSGTDVEYRFLKIRQKYDMELPEGRVRYLQEAVEIVAALTNPIERDVYAGRLSQETDVQKEAILSTAQKLNRKIQYQQKEQAKKEQREIVSAQTVVNTEKKKNLKAALAEEGIIAYLFKNPNRAQALEAQLPPEKFVTPWGSRVYGMLLGKTRSGEVSLSDFAEELTKDEMSELTHVLVSRTEVPPSAQDVEEYIGILCRESGFDSPDRIRAATGQDLQTYLNHLRDHKNGAKED